MNNLAASSEVSKHRLIFRRERRGMDPNKKNEFCNRTTHPMAHLFSIGAESVIAPSVLQADPIRGIMALSRGSSLYPEDHSGRKRL
ncbi:MAG: hypothetical protein V3S64_00840 [bacterium]